MQRPGSRSFARQLPSLVAAIVVSLVAHLAVGIAFARRPRAPVVTFVAAPADASWEIAAPDVVCPPTEPNAPAAAATDPRTVEPHGSRAEPHAVREPSPAPTAHGEPSAPPDVVTTPEASGPRFVMGSVAPAQVASGVVAATAVGQHGGNTTAPVGAPPAAPLAEQAVEVPARLVSGAPPAYTAAAEAAGIEADVPVEIVVDGHGSVLGARSLAHVGYGLDEAALNAVRGYRFTPARRAGSAVAVRMRWVVRFQLR